MEVLNKIGWLNKALYFAFLYYYEISWGQKFERFNLLPNQPSAAWDYLMSQINEPRFCILANPKHIVFRKVSSLEVQHRSVYQSTLKTGHVSDKSLFTFFVFQYICNDTVHTAVQRFQPFSIINWLLFFFLHVSLRIKHLICIYLMNLNLDYHLIIVQLKPWILQGHRLFIAGLGFSSLFGVFQNS